MTQTQTSSVSARQALGLIVIAAVVAALASRLPTWAAERMGSYAALDPVVDVNHLLAQHYYKELKPSELAEGAIGGMIRALDDPYTQFIKAEDKAEFDKQMLGRFVGIGARVRSEEGFVRIVTPMPDSPALRVGVQADDLIVAVDGTSVYGMELQSVIEEMLLGEPDTIVRVTIERDAVRAPEGALPASVPGEVEVEDAGEGLPEIAPGPANDAVRFDLEITRGAIETDTVMGLHREGEDWQYMVDPQRRIAYIRVSQFTPGTITQFEEQARELRARDVRGLILDLRFNSGGALEAAVALADMFLEEGTIVTVRGRSVAPRERSATPGGVLADVPLVVLVNGQSASASEVVSGALKDNDRALVVGERTFGKGLVQGLFNLPSGAGQLKLTESRYYLPSGRLLHREDDSQEWGVDPSQGFEVALTDDAYRAMLDVQLEEQIIRPEGDRAQGEWSNPDWILEYMKDPQLAAAVAALRDRLQHGAWPDGADIPSDLEGVESRSVEQREIVSLERARDAALRRIESIERRIEALSSLAAEDPGDSRDLWDDAIVTEGGRVEVYDEAGALVAVLDITGETLERWLADAPVERVGDQAEAGPDKKDSE